MNKRILRKRSARVVIATLAVVLSGLLAACGSFGRSQGGPTDLPSGTVTSVKVDAKDVTGTTYEICVRADAEAVPLGFKGGKVYCLGDRSAKEAQQCPVGDLYPTCTHNPPSTPPSTAGKK